MTSVWHPGDRQAHVLGGICLLLFAVFAISAAAGYARQAAELYPDFFGIWSFARFITLHAPAQIYDPAQLFAFQRPLEHGHDVTFTFPYPPPYLLILWPLGQLSYGVARIVWSAVTLGAFLLAVCAPIRRPMLALAAALAPATTVCLIYGQNGLLSAALLIGGMRLTSRNPVLAGVLLGAMVYKPQLAILVPVALAAAGLWRTLLIAGATAIGLLAVSSLLLGWDIWPAWIAAIPVHAQLFDAGRGRVNELMPTVQSAVLLLGPAGLAYALQAVATVASACVVWRAWRRHRDSPNSAALVVLAAAAFLATPYAFIYDLPMLAGAVLLLVADRAASKDAFTFAGMLLVIIVLLLPIGLWSEPGILGAPLTVTTLALMMWSVWQTAPEPRSCHCCSP